MFTLITVIVIKRELCVVLHRQIIRDLELLKVIMGTCIAIVFGNDMVLTPLS